MNDSPLLQLPNTYRPFFGSFPHLHDIQKQAIQPILEGRDLILQSATGTGKTEAVLAPCLERVIRSGRAEAVLYLIPTRALALDLMRRLDPIVGQRLGLNLGVRTGDVKRAGGGRADLVLTTPESLDVMMGSSNADLQDLLRRARMVIIDEVHPLVYQYRGRQLAYLLRRLERRRNGPVQRIALSATIADVESVVKFFGFRQDTVRLITSVQREIVPHLVHLKDDENELVALLDDLYEKWNYRKILLFANSRGRCDRLFGLLSEQGRFQRVCELHYSNLKSKERREVEHRFRNRGHALCIATSTLELGIDVGDVDGVVLFEPPDSISGFLQRIGRSNRRRSSTHFWGICRGERASGQLLRFLGLLHSARSGVIESPRPAELPSVLVQQILSCLYEKKRLTLPALRDLFPERADILDNVFQTLEQQGWLREDTTSAYRPKGRSDARNRQTPQQLRIFRGGWRYRDCLLEQRIWSNFPPNEEEYSLDLSGETVADLPKSIVLQLELGDRVYLAGKRIRILQIDAGERKRVLAEPAEGLDEKELFWLGAGFQVSYEVARAIRTILETPSQPADSASLGLFSRTRRLLQITLNRFAETAVLANGIEVSREPNGFFRYWTFLGSAGNLMLRWAIEDGLATRAEDLDGELEEVYVASDEIGIDCSHRIDFKKLSLPLDRKGFERWIRENIKSARPLFSLNAFSEALPLSLLVEEMNDLLFDGRIAEAFLKLTTESSQIVAGDATIFQPRRVEQEPTSRTTLDLAPSRLPESLLEWEKRPWNIAGPRVVSEESGRPPSLASSAVARPAGLDPFSPLEIKAVEHPDTPGKYRLTGTLIGEYIRHGQCSAWLRFSFLPPGIQPPKRTRIDTELGVLRTQSGREHEKRVLDYLRKQSAELIEIREGDGEESGPRPLRERFNESVKRISDLIERAETISSVSNEDLYVAQAVLIAPSICDSEGDSSGVFGGVGIPDLIRISWTERGPLLEVGDIKDSPVPHYGQKWQVAFYRRLLRDLVHSGAIPARAEVSMSGFLITRPIPPATEPAFHSFDPRPFMAALPSLLDNMADVLQSPPSLAECSLREHCATCPWFDYCYRLALREEDILFVPELSTGTIQKMRLLGLRTLEAANEWFEAGRTSSSRPDSGGNEKARSGESCLDLAPRWKESIRGRIGALKTNRISLSKPKTRLYPANLSTAVFLHLLRDPLTNLPRVVGLRIQHDTRKPAEDAFVRVWTVVSEKELPIVRHSFSEQLRNAWRDGAEKGRTVHLFHFGRRSLQILFEWEKISGPADRMDFLMHGRLNRTTDLRRLILDHFHFPAPGVLTLYSIGRILGFTPELAEPESLFHTEDAHSISPAEWESDERVRRETGERVAAILELQEKSWRWAASHLESDLYRTREELEILPTRELSPASAYLRFLDEEKRLHEQDVLALQELSLRERVERFRAIGPLEYARATLDNEGRFLYGLRMREEGFASFSKFREGDFLKLAPIGGTDLQSGLSVILHEYDRNTGQVAVLSRQGRLGLSKRLSYSLEEDLTDWNGPRLAHAVRSVFSEDKQSIRRTLWNIPLRSLFSGGWPVERDGKDLEEWVERWLSSRKVGFGAISGLNTTQQQALRLPFKHRLGIIEGPPGTGKTHLLGWILIALMCQAREAGQTLRIGVSALTHQAIDQVLGKVVELIDLHGHVLQDFPVRCLKWGRWKEGEEGILGTEESAKAKPRVEPLTGPEEISRTPYLILGATGHGLYQLFNSRRDELPAVFDWIIFDEASQVLIPHALLSLIYGKGNFLFIGDVKQLPPIVIGEYETDSTLEDESDPVHRSILAHLLDRYGPELHVRLDETYRMNEELCAFPSRTWYDGALRSAPRIAHARLALDAPSPSPGFAIDDSKDEPIFSHEADLLDRILDPERVVTLVLADHVGCHQKSATEVEIVSQLACRLMARYLINPGRIALISPHRAQNNAIADRLGALLSDHGSNSELPIIDTVERIQGAERDVVIFSLTTSDPDHLTTEFLNNPNRFNVAITRARLKLIVVGSRAFFSAVPHTEDGLRANYCFKEFARFCRERDSIFLWKQTGGYRNDLLT
jgi:superfamily II DNA/RNA helicase